jgi:hypothetical protein
MWRNEYSLIWIGLGGGLLLMGAAAIAVVRGNEQIPDEVRADLALPADSDMHAGATGELISCGGGTQVQTSFAQDGGEFVLLGAFQDVVADRLMVLAPNGELAISLDRPPEVEGEFWGGEAVHIIGDVRADGELEAEEITAACPDVAVREVAGEGGAPPPPAPTMDDASANAGDVATQPDDAPLIQGDDDEDDGSDKDKDKDNGRGHGNGRGGNDKDDDDD